jgi:hypothetical protein
MTSYIKKLPAVFQTVTEKKFFDATFDQVFSKKDSDLLAGYIGRRDPGSYNPITDFYLPEPSKNRTWWQLEATAFARTEDTTKSNIFFYDDLLERIEYYGGNTLNQDRLFDSEYYSFGPPIDYDMFINYHNYYWVEQGLSAITVTGLTYTQFAGKSSFNTNEVPGALPANLTFTTGLSIILADDPAYLDPHTLENFGGCRGIELVTQFSDFTSGTAFEFLPWDGSIELSTGRIITNTVWDAATWDTQTQPGSGDYITIERGALDRNAWSRTNKWFHIDAITSTIAQTGTGFPANSTRALRPIIQFIADIPLYKSGTQFRAEIQYGFYNDNLNAPINFVDVQGQQLSDINTEFDISMSDGDLVCFFNDTTPINVNTFPWDTFMWDTNDWDEGIMSTVSHYIFQANVELDGTVSFSPYTSWTTPIVEGDIVFILEDGPTYSAQRGQTWYFSNGIWEQAFNDKIKLNQPPLFLLYDHNGIPLDDSVTYPASSFAGSEIFSYKVNTESGATADPVLKFPILYTSLGQASDIIFQNDLITERYTYGSAALPINGYYYYKTTQDPVLYNNWNLYQPCPCADIVVDLPPPCNCIVTSKQRVIDKFVVGYGSQYQFKLSVTPYGYVFGAGANQPLADLIVSVNGVEVKSLANQTNGYTFVEINNSVYVSLIAYLTSLLTTTQSQAPVVEVQTYTHELLDPEANGYFQIPQQIEANPNQLEVEEISGSNLTEQFASIINNQIGITGIAFGGTNSYRDSRKNRSVGTYILQNVTPLLKTMLVSSSDDLDFIAAERFSQDEYTKFKNRYLSTALQLINQEFSPVQYKNNTINISVWVGEILRRLNISKEFSNAFAYSYMVAQGTPLYNQLYTGPGNSIVTLTGYVDLNDPKNVMYAYVLLPGGAERMLVDGVDYDIISTNLSIDVQLKLGIASKTVYFTLYKDPIPTYIPSTPTKLGLYSTSIPRLEVDTSYAEQFGTDQYGNPVAPYPTVIIGHDGSKTIAYGDYRDNLLLELETRIYNGLQARYRNQHYLPLRVESVKTGYFRQTRYTRNEYLEITESYLNKWSAKNRANYRSNDWDSASLTTTVNDLWKLYNYRDAVDSLGAPLDLPGNWKGIYQYYYDTFYPATRPWEMLGFSTQPNWWVAQYGTNWSSTNTGMWQDLEAGIIRQGPTAVYDPVTLVAQPQEMWARPGMVANNLIPVDALGVLRPVLDIANPANSLFDVAYSGNPYAPFDHFNDDWIYGDGSPVEQAWMATSAYTYSVQEFLYLMRPAAYGELMWDSLGTSLSPGMITVPASAEQVISNTNWQYVQNETYTSDDAFFAWMRPKNKDQIVHAEPVNGSIQVRFGYQSWISDRILFLGSDVTSVFGQKVRTLDVNLANKLAGFTNKDTTNTYIESVSPGAANNSLIIPSTNFSVILHKSPVVDTYSYSGVVIRALADGTFVVYGYDLLSSEFTVLDRSTAKLIDVSIGGTPAEFQYFTSGATYAAGDIVRYNGIYYTSLVTQTVQKFEASGYQKLKALPTVGGVSVTYKPVSETTTTKIPYGSVLQNPQAVFDMLIGWGAYLESQGWKFDEVNQDTNILSDWLASAKQFLFWLNTEWAPDASIQLSPLANKATLVVSRGYPNDVETISNGVYSILDKFGVAIAPANTMTDRDGKMISVEPSNLATGGIYYLQVSTAETEHVLIFDNVTNFNDTVYSPLLRARQQRLRFNGFRSNAWYGKMEAPGYLVIADQLVPNFDTIVEAMRYYYDPNVTIDNPSLEDLGRHLIGYESKSYLDNLQLSNDVQYLFYQGAIRQKGTAQAFEKLFRSTKVQSNEIIEVFEEWALKLGDFGNTVEQVSTEFILKPEQNTGEVIVARLNYVPSTLGFVRQINILNAETIYTSIPAIIVDPAAICTRQAKAYAVLDSAGRISRIDITDPGEGYLSAPAIISPNLVDKFYSVWQGEVYTDPALDNVIDIDIDETDVWTVRPVDPTYSLEFPTTSKIDYPLPNAGYVNFNDVTLTSFDVTQTAVKWGTTNFNPMEGNTIWIAKTFTEDWDVYKLVDAGQAFDVVENTAGELFLRTLTTDQFITSQFSTSGNVTNFGNMIVLQGTDTSTSPVSDTNYAVGFEFNAAETTSASDGYNYYNLMTLAAVPITSTEIPSYAEFTKLMLFKTMRFLTAPVAPNLPSYVSLDELVWVDDINGKWAVLKTAATPGIWDNTVFDIPIGATWEMYAGWDVTGPIYLNLYRLEDALINSSLFKSAGVFATGDGSELVQLPVYDPFKNILPGPARQNITYTSMQDPARYNVTANERLFSENITFADRQVGQLWWDLSSTRYVYYEQPAAVTETSVDNLKYRRDHWGQIFPGSTVDIYEWVSSDVPPAEYTGSGIPRDTTTYVEVVTSNRFTNITEVKYYFWVLDSTDRPNVENRTMAALDVARLLQSPKSQGFAFFAPIQQTPINNSYMFYNVQEILAYRGDNIQIQYRLAERNDQQHAQWSLFREGDTGSVVTDQFWNKMVDSLCGYTQVLPLSSEYNGIPVTGGEILPVPDPTLSEGEKYGVEYRPRQGMFTNLLAARKVFVQSANDLLKHIAIRDDNPGWNAGVPTDVYWKYINWYKVGYEDVLPTIVYSTLAAAIAAVTAGNLTVDTILQVTNGTIDGRFTLYAVVQLNPNVATLSLEEVCVENSAIELLPTVYTTSNVYGLSVELRDLLNAFRTQVMINDYRVDQNLLFFSIMNYVVSEQRNPNWLFKTSYIYIKENNLPLTQDNLYIPDQINNIIDYIVDSKPYHTQIRDYTSTYVTSDTAAGTAADGIKDSFGNSDGSWVKKNITLQFGPDSMESVNSGDWDANCNDPLLFLPWDSYAWDVCPAPVYTLTARTFIDNIDQFVSQENVYTVDLPLSKYDPTKKKLSQLFPYTFNFINSTIITPTDIVGVQIGTTILVYGQDYYAEYNADTLDYTIYFYNDPSLTVNIPVALIWFDGGGFQNFTYNTVRNEVAHGYANDDLVVNVDTKQPVSNNGGVIGSYLTGWDIQPWEMSGAVNIPWDNDPVPFNNILSITHVGNVATLTSAAPHGIPVSPEFWTIVEGVFPVQYNGTHPITVTSPTTFTYVMSSIPASNATTVGTYYLLLADSTISYRENTNISNGPNFYRNADTYAGTLVNDLAAPTKETENIDVITVSAAADIFPEPGVTPGVIWIDGERIEYRMKTFVSAGTWELQMVRRGTMGTSAVAHSNTVPEINPITDVNGNTVIKNPIVLVPNKVWVEEGNELLLGADITVWNAVDSAGDPATEVVWNSLSSYTAGDRVGYLGNVYSANREISPAESNPLVNANWSYVSVGSVYTSISSVAPGGIWYATTPEAVFLKQQQGSSLP